jgi:hypothetical protein
VADAFSEFLDDHRAEHRSAFNQWCLVFGDSLQIIGVLSVLRGRWRGGALLTAVGLGIATTGHVRDGNVAKSLETVRLHPLWNIRGDIAIARDILARRRRREDGAVAGGVAA